MIQQTINYVKSELENAEGGHDWWHIYRVWKTAIQISASEPVDRRIVELGALLHDIADSKFHDGDETVGPRKATDFLNTIGVDQKTINHVILIIQNISFGGGNFEKKFQSPELDVVQDADRLDALGAIGIARTFNYGGFKNRTIYDPNIPPQLNMSKAEYKKSTAPSVNHFYEKLLLLKGRMNTQTGKKMAQQRHQFMETYLDQFYQEWEGKK